MRAGSPLRHPRLSVMPRKQHERVRVRKSRTSKQQTNNLLRYFYEEKKKKRKKKKKDKKKKRCAVLVPPSLRARKKKKKPLSSAKDLRLKNSFYLIKINKTKCIRTYFTLSFTH